MRKITKFTTLILALAMVFSLAMSIQTEAAAKVKLSKAKLTLDVKEEYLLKVNGTQKKITWKSSNKKVATVSKKGKVTAKKAGTAVITAKAGKKNYTCKVTVKEAKLNKTKVTLTVKGTYQLKVKGTSKNAIWKSSNKKVATVSKSGKVTAKKAGNTVITAKVGKRTLKCKVTVTNCNHKWVKHYSTKKVWHESEKEYFTICSCGRQYSDVESHTIHATKIWWKNDGVHSSSSGCFQKPDFYTMEKYVDYRYCSKCKQKKKTPLPDNEVKQKNCDHQWGQRWNTEKIFHKGESITYYNCSPCGLTFDTLEEFNAHKAKDSNGTHNCWTYIFQEPDYYTSGKSEFAYFYCSLCGAHADTPYWN